MKLICKKNGPTTIRTLDKLQNSTKYATKTNNYLKKKTNEKPITAQEAKMTTFFAQDCV